MARRMREENQQFEDVSSYSSSKEYKKRRKRKWGRIVLKSIAAFVCIMLIVVGSGMVYVSTEIIGDLTTTTITKDPEVLGFAPTVHEEIEDGSITNIALFGVDSRYGTFTGLSDAIMIFSVDNKHSKLKMVSILRDSQVSVQGDTYSSGTVDYSTKINHAYSLGGPELAIRTLNRNFGLQIEDYVTVNFGNMAAIVDAFGGVAIELTSAEAYAINQNLQLLEQEYAYSIISYSDYLQDLSGGTYLLNGNQAVAYGRIRSLDSDNVRATRQQKVLKQLISNISDISITEYPQLISELMPLCETSMDLQDVITLAPILASDFTMESITVPDFDYEDPVDVNYNYVFDLTIAAERINSFIYEENSPYWDKYGNTSLDNSGNSE